MHLLRAVQSRPNDAAAYRELGVYYVEQGRPITGLWELVIAQELGAVDPETPLRVAEALRQAGLRQTAIRRLSEARRDISGHTSFDLELARIYLEVADPPSALDALGQNRTLAASPAGLLLLAPARFALGHVKEARAALSRLQSSQQDASLTPHQRLVTGRLALAMGERTAARDWLAAAARDNPGDEAAQYYAGLAFTTGSAAERERAIYYLKAAARADPRKARAAVMLGRLLFEEKGQPDQAAEIYRQALAVEPQHREAEESLARVRAALKQPAEAVYHQARVLELKDRPDEALALYRRWGKLRPERWDSVLRAAECWMDMGRYPEAAREIEGGVARFPDNPELMAHLAQLYLRTANRADAARLCQRWAPLDRVSGRPEWIQGQLAFQSLRISEAVRWHEAAVRKKPKMGVYQAALGEALAGEPSPERLRRARAALERATTLNPGVAHFEYQLGLVLQQMGDLDGARTSFLRAMEGSGNSLEAHRGLMAVARRLGRPGAAAFFTRLEREVRDQQRHEAAARRRLWRQPRDAGTRLALARLLLRRGALAEARNHLEVAAEQRDGTAARALLQRVERLLSVL